MYITPRSHNEGLDDILVLSRYHRYMLESDPVPHDPDVHLVHHYEPFTNEPLTVALNFDECVAFQATIRAANDNIAKYLCDTCETQRDHHAAVLWHTGEPLDNVNAAYEVVLPNLAHFPMQISVAFCSEESEDDYNESADCLYGEMQRIVEDNGLIGPVASSDTLIGLLCAIHLRKTLAFFEDSSMVQEMVECAIIESRYPVNCDEKIWHYAMGVYAAADCLGLF